VVVSSVQIDISRPTRETALLEMALLGAEDASPVLKVTQQIEEFGYDSVWAGDSFVARPRLEPMTLLAAVARETDRVLVGTAALIAPGREPAAVAGRQRQACRGRRALPRLDADPSRR
jgi:alkanesulfonate monooxygenase SsuD/methylene tetrahydromethanopterin reductase-like flavin-dependent oxidoreductase (luciferase family)